MKTITIIFVGLIAHVNQPRLSLDDTAVLPYVEDHIAQMVVRRDAIANPADPWVERHCENDPCVFPLSRTVVRLEGTTGMFCNKDALSRAVPKLGTLGARCGSLRKAVRERDVAVTGADSVPDFASFVDYGAGRLTVDTYFEDKLGFQGKAGPLSCVACRVRYDGRLAGTEAVFVFRSYGDSEPKQLRIKGDYYVTVENNPVDETHPPQRAEDSHFLAYYSLLNDCEIDCDGAGPPCPTIYGDCTQPNLCDLENELLGKTALAVNDSGTRRVPLADCTNSQYP